MLVLVILLSIWVFLKTISYGIYEIKQNNNKPGGIIVILVSFISLIFPIIPMVIY